MLDGSFILATSAIHLITIVPVKLLGLMYFLIADLLVHIPMDLIVGRSTPALGTSFDIIGVPGQ